MGLLTISNFSSKLLSFLLVPLYTSVLTTKDYGIYDIFNTTIMLLIPILTMGIIESVLRFPLENRENSEVIYLVGLKHVLRGFFILIIVCGINYVYTFSDTLLKYNIFFIFLYITAVVSQMLQNFARGIEKVSSLAVSGILSSIAVISLNILFLLYLDLGLVGYFLANILGMVISIIYLVFSLGVWKYKLSRKIDKKLEKEMLNYSIPTIANSISWWVNNAADRYIIISLFGLATNGIYSVSYKIPSIMNVFQTIFNQAWTISAVQEFDKNDSNGFYKNVYSGTNFVMITVCSILILLTKVLARLLYKNQFYSAWTYVPYLLISILFGVLCGVLGGVYTATKDSKKLGSSTVIGAVVNVIAGYLLSVLIGPIGAALGTLLSYIIVWLIRLVDVKKYMKLRINLKRDVISYVVLLLQAIELIYVKEGILLYSTQTILFLIILLMYMNELKMLLKNIIS
ncbi:lipopolysaccharide biosynthesis protein [Ligilactobacillus salivarius]|uniref:lipopolysaccharide biosynthesis protein n=1 Tax=Ligilactobacillus salivarius TaxID=1624 RepID=UPI000BAFDFF5|nr:oligosaccharide flippase family protein [Ligilactobacillus salivarius]QXL49302.1 oligosaccharide flippase family protein [Ligilactobacillus salivarius]